MATGIRDKVAIIGMGCTKFGERWESSAEDLIVEAFQEALADAGIQKKDIQAAWFGTHIDEVNVGKSGVPLSTTLKLPFIPVTRTENYCATGTEAFRGACYAVAAGVYDICLALGVEKLKDTGYGGLPATAAFGQMQALIGPNATAPGLFAQLATSYFAKYGIDPAVGKKALAHISAKSHFNGAMNPKAHLRRPVSEDQIIHAPMIAYPLGFFARGDANRQGFNQNGVLFFKRPGDLRRGYDGRRRPIAYPATVEKAQGVGNHGSVNDLVLGHRPSKVGLGVHGPVEMTFS